MWIQNSFVPYSTAWDANHEYMYYPKVLAENAGIYRWNTMINEMPWFWHQFLTFIFSLTWCTGWWFGLSPDNIAISMNNMSALFVLIFWIAIVFQIFDLIKKNKKWEDENKNTELKKWNKWIISEQQLENKHWIAMWRYIMLLWLTAWMWAFLVIVDNKTDLWVMALSLLALLAGLIFLQYKKVSNDKKEILKYVIIAWLFFWFAALAKVTSFVDFMLFGLLLVWLRFSPLATLGLWITVMWIVRKFNILTSSVMLNESNATWFIIVWLSLTAVWIIVHLLKKTNRKDFFKNIVHLLILWGCFLAPIVFLKLPRTIFSQIKSNSFSFSNSLKSVLLTTNTTDTKFSEKLLAQNTIDETENDWSNVADYTDKAPLESQDTLDSQIIESKNRQDFVQCLSAGNIYSDKELNENLESLVVWWWWEDYWRYIWYWWKEFKRTNIFNIDENTAKTKRFRFFKVFWPTSKKCQSNNADNQICEKNWMFALTKAIWPTSDTCYWLNHDAKILCNNSEIIDNFRIDDLRGIYENGIKNKNWEAGLLLKEAIDSYDKAKAEWRLWFWVSNTAIFHDEIINLRQYYQSHSISSKGDSIYIPYRYLVPLNITFNWSLQNLSSYYTDIGYIWIIVFILLLVALPYAIVKKDKLLITASLTTLIWWWVWRIIWSAILRYGTALIYWSMITLAILWDSILCKKDDCLKIATYFLIGIVWIFFWIQILFNFLRISSQWANSVFVRYKWNVWQEYTIDENLQQKSKPKIKLYTRKNIFDLQFPQYNPIINGLADRKDKDWVTIAWTYIQYFLWNQRNLRSDPMLNEFWRNASDWDLCKTYRRLKNANTRYFIVDPNIWTVTMWEWNERLFYRFFWKLNAEWNKSEIDWTIITLVRLYKAGYLKLFSTNNLWAKYAFTLDDQIFKSLFWEMNDEELIITRAKMAVLQYFNDSNIFYSVANIFISRILNDTKAWIEDIANIYWLEIDSDKVAEVAYKYINWQAGEWLAKDLNQNERTVLVNYLNVYMAYAQWQTESWQSIVQNLLMNSVSWWSQIIALELN